MRVQEYSFDNHFSYISKLEKLMKEYPQAIFTLNHETLVYIKAEHNQTVYGHPCIRIDKDNWHFTGNRTVPRATKFYFTRKEAVESEGQKIIGTDLQSKFPC